MNPRALSIILAGAFLACPSLAFGAGWNTMRFDLTKANAEAYATVNIPDTAFTAEGLQIAVKPDAKYEFLSKQTFYDLFTFEVYFEIADQSKAGSIEVDVIAVNEESKDKIVCTYTVTGDGKRSCQYSSYVKGRKDFTRRPDIDLSYETATERRIGTVEALRIYKGEEGLYATAKLKWTFRIYWPETDEFRMETDSNWRRMYQGAIRPKQDDKYKVGFVLRSIGGATGSVHIKGVEISGSTTPPEPAKRTFLFDFGRDSQELADGFCPVTPRTRYSRQRGFGWVFEDESRLVRTPREVAPATDEAIEAAGLRSPRELYEDLARRKKLVKTNAASMKEYETKLRRKVESTRKEFRIFLEHKLVFSTRSKGSTWIKSLGKHLDLNTPLERDGVYLATCGGLFPPSQRGTVFLKRGPPFPSGGPAHHAPEVYEKQRSIYDDDDAAGEFRVDVPNGAYNILVGSDYEYAWRRWPAASVAVEGRLRKKKVGERGQRAVIRNVVVQDGTLNLRLFCNPRESGNVKWAINYLIVLPAEEKELVNQWEWKLILKHGIRVRQVAFAEGDPAVLRNEGGFYTLNGKPFFFQSTYFPTAYMEHYPYYCQVNGVLLDGVKAKSQHFLRPDWEKLSLMENYPWKLVNTLNTYYQNGFLVNAMMAGVLTVVPRHVQGEAATAIDSKGRVPRYHVKPPINSALGKEVVTETFTIMGNWLKMHPAHTAYYLYMEEWDIGEKRYDDQSRAQYMGWLEEKYKTIGALNEDWDRAYKSFDDIPLPDERYARRTAGWKRTPENIMFSKFAQWGGSQMVKQACKVIHENEPYHIAAGGTCEFPVSFCHNVKYEDTTPFPPHQTIRYFGHAPHHGYNWPGYTCEYAYSQGRTNLKQREKPPRYLATNIRKDYLRAINSIFNGAKWGHIPEWYEDGSRHFFHPTVLIKELGPRNAIKHWTGEILGFKPEAYEGAPVMIERKALILTRAFQWYYRLAPLWIPAQPPRAEILAPVSETCLTLAGSGGRQLRKAVPGASDLLRPNLLVPDIVEITSVKDLSRYKVIMLSDAKNVARYLDRTAVRRLQDYVRKGGKLTILGGAFFDDPRVDRAIKLTELFGLGKKAIEQADGGKRAGGVRKLGPGLYLNGPGNVALVTATDGAATQESYAKLLQSWKVRIHLGIAGAKDPVDDISAGRLNGDGYVIAGACNLNKEAPQSFRLQVHGLTPGEYAVMDVTGERPELVKKKDGGWALKPNPSQRGIKIDYRVTSTDLAVKGIPCEIQPQQAQIFMLRPIDDKVWVAIWRPALKWFVKRPVTVAYGSDSDEKAGALAIQSALAKCGVRAEMVEAGKIKLKKMHHEVRIDPMRGVLDRLTKRMPWKKREYHELFKKKYGYKGKKYLVDTFDNEVVDSDRQLVVLGNAATNVLVRHFNKEGSYAYDKVLDKITAAYPGPGRGIIGIVESVNCPHYDVTSKSRDAILVGGSDAAGTAAAVKAFVRLLGKYAK